MLYYMGLLQIIVTGVYAWHCSLNIAKPKKTGMVIPVYPETPELRDPCDGCMNSCENCCPGALTSDSKGV